MFFAHKENGEQVEKHSSRVYLENHERGQHKEFGADSFSG